jgi:outer membrane protein assembly factor BamB
MCLVIVGSMNGDGVNRRTMLAGLAAAGIVVVTRASTASAAVTTAAGRQLWQCATPAGLSTVVAANGVVCAGILAPDETSKNAQNGVYAIDAATGKRAWAQWGSGGLLPFTAGPGVVYCVSLDGIAAVSTGTGRVLWNNTDLGLADPGAAPVWGLYDGGDVYTTTLGRTGAGVAAITGRTGQKRWFAAAAHPPTALAVGSGAVYVGWPADKGGVLAALDAATGARLWTKAISTIPGRLALTGGVLVGITSQSAVSPSGSPDNSTFALDAGTGRVLWQSPDSQLITMVAGNGIVYTSAARVEARDVRTGRYLWRQSGEQGQPEVLILAGDTLYAAGARLRVRALSASTGRTLRSYTLPVSGPAAAGETGTLAVGNGVLYIGTELPGSGDPGHVYAIKA